MTLTKPAKTDHIDVMISSTARDLPDHRQQVIEACLRMSMHPIAMEHLAALDEDAVEASLRMVDEAEIYVGVFAFRYGYVPKKNNPDGLSITEMEYNRAVERGIPRLIFFMHDDHPVKPADVERGAGSEKLQAFKDRIGTERVAGFFKSPEELRSLVIQALVPYRVSKPEQLAPTMRAELPIPPEKYVVHHYSLMETSKFVGRTEELNALKAWVTPGSPIYNTAFFVVTALGGQGKSALTWHWFNTLAESQMQPLAGRFWWSFYETNADFEAFEIEALAYAGKLPRAEVTALTRDERQRRLFEILDKQPFLLVLDGLERILIAYARMDAARLIDDEYDQRTNNRVAGALGLPPETADSFIGQHPLRKTADPRAGAFLRRLATCKATKLLVSTRLYPSELQTVTGTPLPGCVAQFLLGLTDDDAISLWRAMNVTGERAELLQMFHTFNNYALLIRALAGEVSRYKRKPGDFDAWRKANPNFDPFQKLPMMQVKSHVLQFALQGLTDPERQVLHTIAAFRMPATYDTLAALLVGEGKPFADEHSFDDVLMRLEDRGLVGWDKAQNRYDLHPITRGVTWDVLNQNARHGIYQSLASYFGALPKIAQSDVETESDLNPAIEYYDKLIGLERYEDAWDVFSQWLAEVTLNRFNTSRLRYELLEKLFPDGTDRPPRLSRPGWQAAALNALAQGYQYSGEPGKSLPFYKRHNIIRQSQQDEQNLQAGFVNYATPLRDVGHLYLAEHQIRLAFQILESAPDDMRATIVFRIAGYILGTRAPLLNKNKKNEAESMLLRSISIMETPHGNFIWAGYDQCYLAQIYLWRQDYNDAQKYADQGLYYGEQLKNIRHIIGATRLKGEASLRLDQLSPAQQLLNSALTNARTTSFAEEELPALVALAELHRRHGEATDARERLDEVWEMAERGPYPLFHADALNVLAQIERDAGNRDAAIKAASEAYRKAWCDGPPYAYHWGLENAKRHLDALGAPYPTDVKPFDPSEHEPMPDVEI